MILTALLLSIVATKPPPATYDQAIRDAVRDVEKIHPVPVPLVQAIIRVESNWNPDALSSAGAVGLMQVMPWNAERLGLRAKDLRDPAKNILAGVRLLAVLLMHYEGDVISALAAYNARPRKLGAPLPKNGETPRYVRRVLEFYEAYQLAASTADAGVPAPL